ncbi:biotin transporter BioY [Haloarcula sp. CBA1130]|uniref:biotin transporter BioY n=1 Tax=unclassified Haloarcula TaxID=2624677 RepID=UPI0012489537|nr:MULTISPECIES: biotin transporter BioY [unclassified Haloarcula]KAA9399652.1 biotin transporter BioY [Haloarcula sp. CBA1129]KAA9401376.1 biotin transporter BioY [Haloarcula sp. CBA1130]
MATEQSVDLVDDDTVGWFTKAVLLAALTAALAQISIPLPGPLVPFSLQPFGMFFAGLLLGPLWGGVALLLYLLVGIAGVPVFSNGSAGIGYVIAGKSGGFLVGFLVGAVVAGAIAHRSTSPRPVADLSIPVQALALTAAIVVVYAIGIPWMSMVTGLSLTRAAALMAPYVPLDLVKLGVAIAIVQGGYLSGR